MWLLRIHTYSHSLSLSLPLSLSPPPSPPHPPFLSFSFGLVPASPLAVQSPLFPNQSANASLPINAGGPVMKMSPLSNLQIAVKDNVDVLYFSAEVPMNVFFVEDGALGKVTLCSTCTCMPLWCLFHWASIHVNVHVTFFTSLSLSLSFSPLSLSTPPPPLRSQGVPCHLEGDSSVQWGSVYHLGCEPSCWHGRTASQGQQHLHDRSSQRWCGRTAAGTHVHVSEICEQHLGAHGGQGHCWWPLCWGKCASNK